MQGLNFIEPHKLRVNIAQHVYRKLAFPRYRLPIRSCSTADYGIFRPLNLKANEKKLEVEMSFIEGFEDEEFEVDGTQFMSKKSQQNGSGESSDKLKSPVISSTDALAFFAKPRGAVLGVVAPKKDNKQVASPAPIKEQENKHVKRTKNKKRTVYIEKTKEPIPKKQEPTKLVDEEKSVAVPPKKDEQNVRLQEEKKEDNNLPEAYDASEVDSDDTDDAVSMFGQSVADVAASEDWDAGEDNL